MHGGCVEMERRGGSVRAFCRNREHQRPHRSRAAAQRCTYDRIAASGIVRGADRMQSDCTPFPAPLSLSLSFSSRLGIMLMSSKDGLKAGVRENGRMQSGCFHPASIKLYLSRLQKEIARRCAKTIVSVCFFDITIHRSIYSSELIEMRKSMCKFN